MKYLGILLFVVATTIASFAQSFNEIQAQFKQAKKNGEDSLTAVYAIQLGNAAWELNKQRRRIVVSFESVEYYYKEGIRAATNISDTLLIGSAHFQLARLYASRSKKPFLQKALSELAKARNLYAASNDTIPFAEVQYAAAKIKMNSREYADAAIAMIEAMDYYEKAKEFDKAQDCARDLVDIFQRLGNTNKADFYEQEAVRLSNSSRELAQRDLLIQLKEDSIAIQQKDLALKEQEVARQKTEAALQKAEAARQRNNFIYAIIIIIISVISLVFALRAQRKISSKKKEVEKLLLNILPKKTAEELRLTGTATPQSYARVTVLFTDFKGFTQVSEKMTPVEIIEELGICFSAFDEIIEKNNLEKIKTIGDAYMCAGGVPEPNQSNPIDAARAALAMQEFMKRRIEENRLHGRPILELRIGIHTGPVVAGVVGKKKFAYDIWGDAVNIAARMESSGEANKVNVSGETYSLIKDQFECTYRGKIPAKNKGEIDMYFVEREK